MMYKNHAPFLSSLNTILIRQIDNIDSHYHYLTESTINFMLGLIEGNHEDNAKMLSSKVRA
jgi:hypothetical protein